MKEARRTSRFTTAALLTLALLSAALLAPAATAAPPVGADDTAPAGWWSWLTEPVGQILAAMGPGWEPMGLTADGEDTPTVDGGETQTVEDPDLDTGGEMGPGWEPMG